MFLTCLKQKGMAKMLTPMMLLARVSTNLNMLLAGPDAGKGFPRREGFLRPAGPTGPTDSASDPAVPSERRG